MSAPRVRQKPSAVAVAVAPFVRLINAGHLGSFFCCGLGLVCGSAFSLVWVVKDLAGGSPWNMEQSKEAMVGSSEALWESIDVGCEAKGRRMPWAGVCRGRSSPGGGPWAVKPGSTEGAKAKQQNRAYLCLRQSPIRHLN